MSSLSGDAGLATGDSRISREPKILTIGEGTDEVQQMVIARALGA